MITLKNNFHNTETKIRANVGDILTEIQVKRIERRLCPYSECGCTPVRGKQEYNLDPIGFEFDRSVERVVYKVISQNDKEKI